MVRPLCSYSAYASLLIGAAVAASAAGCAASPSPCASAAACGKGKICVAGRCRPKKQAPTKGSAQRVMLEPLAVDVVASQGPEPFDLATVPLGKEALGELVVLLQFPAPFSDSTQILSAHVVMSPAPGAIPGPAPVELRVSRILDPWTPEDSSWATLPSLSATEATFLASTWGGRVLRLDVTDQVRRWREHRHDDQGLAILASPQNEVGATYSLGFTGADGPKLDVYLR